LNLTDLTILDGYHCAVTIDAATGAVARCSIEQLQSTLSAWVARGGLLIAHGTVEAGAASEFLHDPILRGYVDTGAKLAVLCQRKIDAILIERDLRLRFARH
jgi:hypothetical protein